ncbi:AraC-like DNA-binding protein [Pseudoxanthomonas japonensis]|uniref:AraC family transcriptional regulator n=1 Tax=Pseudoxanthomonas TaxID=83618 RepID=UPI000ADFADC6|nr:MULTISPECIES: AraC family transcriptional regulator [Pseudoxanthomonas]MDR7069680.1 AraC-like DNA-binding protein [Pseudoxanthomonas japonensis]
MRWKTGLGNRLSIANLPTNMLCGLVLLAGEFGVNAEGWFSGMRLNVQEIHDPQARVSYRQASEIIRRALPTLPIDGVGLAMGEKQNGGNFGVLGLAMKTAPTFGDAVLIGLAYQRNLGPLMDLNLQDRDDGSLAVVATAPEEAADLLPFLCEEMFASTLMLARELAGPEFHPLRLELGYPAPRYAARYDDLFACEVRFNQAQHALVVDRRWLEMPFASYNPVTSRQALALCQAQLAAMSLRGETTAAVERQLRPRLRENPQMTDVATALHLSERTLRRQLAEEGTSFSAVHDRVRTERALDLLQEAELTIAAVGGLIGFNDVREFRRAFKRWTGHTPSETRLPVSSRQAV